MLEGQTPRSGASESATGLAVAAGFELAESAPLDADLVRRAIHILHALVTAGDAADDFGLAQAASEALPKPHAAVLLAGA